MPKELIGLDIGSHSIKLVRMKKTSKGPLLTCAGMKEIPPSQNGKEAGSAAQALKTLLDETGVKSGTIHLVVSGQGAYFRRITLPSMPKGELREAVRWEIKGGLPYPAEKAQIEFQVLKEFVEERVRKRDLIVAACPNESIERTVSIVRDAGMKAAHLGAAPLALQNALRFWQGPGRDGIIALADLGATKTAIYLFMKGNLQFSREATPGGSDITQAIFEGIGLDKDPDLGFQQAERIKRELGIVMDPNTPEQSKISFLMRPVLEKLTTEISRSLDYSRNQFHVEQIDRLLLTGGGANLKNISAYLAADLRLPVEIFNPFKEISVDSNSVDIRAVELAGSRYAIAAGVALPEPKTIEFLPGKKPTLSGFSPEKWAPVAAPVATALILSFIAWNLNGQLIAVQKEHELKTTQTVSADSIQARLLRLKEKERQMKQEISRFASWEPGSASYGEILKEISQSVPGTVSLKLLAVQPGVSTAREESTVPEGMQLLLAGFALGHDLQCLTALAELIEHLEKSSLFRNAKLASAEGAKMHHQAGVNFEITCDIVSTPEGTLKP